MEHHMLLVYAHLLLFAYWLAPDWGVYVNSAYVARADLPVAERKRFLQAALRIDLVPRSCLILLLPFGLQLATNLQLVPLQGWPIAVVWCAALLWLVMSWTIHRRQATALAQSLRRFDHGLRFVLALILIAWGVWSLATDDGVPVAWLATKLIGFGTLLLLGLLLRRVMGGWAAGFARLEAEGSSPQTEAIFAGALRRAKPIVYLFWLNSAGMAALGLLKPF